MKKSLASLMLLLSASIQATEIDVVEDNKAVFYVNKSKMVCGKVHQVKKSKQQTYINLGGAYPHQNIAFLVWDSDLPPFKVKFGELDSLQQQRVCARGKIEDYKGKLQIIVKEPNFLRLMDTK